MSSNLFLLVYILVLFSFSHCYRRRLSSYLSLVVIGDVLVLYLSLVVVGDVLVLYLSLVVVGDV